MNVGILGTGTISSAIVTGFCTSEAGKTLTFYLSPRNAEKAEALKTAYPDQVTVCPDNQTVVDRSDWVFLTLLPGHGEAVLKGLNFRPEQKILTIMSDHSIARISGWIGPVSRIIRMVPLPFAAMHIGPIAYFPRDPEIEDLFGPLGKLIPVDREAELSVISGLTGIMSAYYMLIHETVGFGIEQGLSARTSLDYMSGFFEALSVKAGAKEDLDIYGLAYEMTPGGLNEMALKSILADDGYQPWISALQKVMDRLNKK